MSQNQFTNPEIVLTYKDGADCVRVLSCLRANITVLSSGFIQVVHYHDGLKVPENKRLILLSPDRFIMSHSFGYAT